MKLFTTTGLIVAAMFLIGSGCTKSGKSSKDITINIKSQEGEPLAQVGQLTLTVEAMREDFQARQGQFRGAPNLNSEKARSEYIENQVLQKAMFLDAIEQGYFSRMDVLRDVEKVVVQRLMRDKLEKAQNEFVPTDEQIKEHYDKNANLYNREEAVRVAFISIPFGKDKNKTREIATAIHKEAVANVKNANSKAFSRLALDNAEKIASNGQGSVETNETDYLDKAGFEAKFGPNLFETISSMENVGQIAELSTTDQGYLILMKTGQRKAINETLEDAKAKIVKRLSYEARGDLYKKYTEDLKKKYDIKVFNERLAELSKETQPENLAQNTPAGQQEAKAPKAEIAAPKAPAVNQQGGTEQPKATMN